MQVTRVAMALVLLSATPALARSPWVRFTDPTEHAFSIDVPQGWTVRGGMVRRSIMQAHPIISVISPRGTTQFVLGNVDGWTYATTSPIGRRLGFREGTPYSPGADNLIMLDYRTGIQFARMIGHRIFPRACQDVHEVNARVLSRPRWQRTPQGLVATSSSGEVFYTCFKNGHRMDAYTYSETVMTGGTTRSGGIWNADLTDSFITPEGEGGAAGAILAHMVRSFRLDPRWFARQSRISMQAANHALSVANAQLDEEATSLNGTFSGTAKAAAANQEDFRRLISGFDEYQTTTGNLKSVPYAAAQHWWSNGSSTVGTQGPFAPGPNFQELRRVPPNQ